MNTHRMDPCTGDPCSLYDSERPGKYALEVNAGLMLIMTETEKAGILLDSYSKQLVNQSPIAVMSVHSRDTRLSGQAGY